MEHRRHRTNSAKRRTTLTLPADSLRQAERIARARKVNLSTVVAEALSNGLMMHTQQSVVNRYCNPTRKRSLHSPMKR